MIEKKLFLRLRLDGGRQLLVVSGQDALARSEQGDPAAALQSLGALVNHHPVEVVGRQVLEGPAVAGACGTHAAVP